MGTKVTVSVNKTFDVNADVDRVFDLLANVPESASHYPNVDKLNDKGDGVYEWVMEEIGVGGFSHQVIYASKYVGDKAAGTVEWTPAGGNSDISGNWKLSDNGNGTTCQFTVNADLDIPVPRLLKGMAKPMVEQQFNGQIDEYIGNLKNTLA